MGDPTSRSKSPRDNALERARKDLAGGRPDLARDRVTGFLYTLHRRGEYNQEAYLLLGEIYFAMRDFPRAGAAWLLTERSGEDAEMAINAFHQRYGRDPANILHAIKPHAPSEDYPSSVQERLKSWNYRYRRYRSREHPDEIAKDDGEQRGLRGIEIGCLLGALTVGVLALMWIYFNFFARR